jgi:putative transposase
MTEKLVAKSSPSFESNLDPVEETAAVQPEVGGLVARRPVDAGAVSLEDQELELARELVRQARASGMALTGPGGLLKSVTKLVIETALEEKMSEHLGYDGHAVEGRNRGNSRNGKPSKTVLTDAAGAVEIEVPRDREGTFAPVIARLAAAWAVGHRHGRAEPVQPRADQRGDQRALRRGLRGERVQGHDHADHRHPEFDSS